METDRTTWGGVVIEHDRLPADGIPADVVLAPSPTTRTLASIMVRRPVTRTLDIGTGCGALALLASRFAGEVVATDVNPRALAYTSRNAAANGITNVECIESSLVDAVDGPRFDLIVGNLPFVISPATTLTFRDGVRPTTTGRDICETAVIDSAGVLADGGIAQFLVNWIITDPARPYDAPISWVRPTGCNGLVLWHSRQSPEDYVAAWARSPHDDRAEWLAHLARRGAVAIANGAIVIHRPIRAEPEPVIRSAPISSPRGQGGRQVDRILHVGSPSELGILSGRPRLVASTTTDESARDGRRSARIRAHDSCGITATVPIDQLDLLDLLDGDRPLDDAIARWSGSTGVRSAEQLTERTAAAVVTVLRLLVHGLMELDPG